MTTAQTNLEQEIRGLGFEPLRSNGKHLIMRHPTAGSFPLPTTVGRGRAHKNSVATARRLIRQSNTVTTQFVDWLCERHGVAVDDRQRLRVTVSQEVEWFAAENKDQRINTSSLATMARQHPRVTTIPQTSKRYSVWEVAGRDWVAPEPEVVESKKPKAIVEAPSPEVVPPTSESSPEPGVVALHDAVEALQKHNDAVGKMEVAVAALKQMQAEIGELIALLEKS